MIHFDDIKTIANRLNVEISPIQVNEVIARYNERVSNGTWDIYIEDLIYNIINN